MSSGNPIKDYKKLSKALTGRADPEAKRESKIEKQNRLNRERNLAAAAGQVPEPESKPESKIEKQNRLNRERNLAAAAEKKRLSEVARVNEMLGAKPRK